MAIGNVGISFQPGQEQAARSATPVQQAIKLMSLRLPTVVGASAPIPSALLNAPGGATSSPALSKLAETASPTSGTPARRRTLLDSLFSAFANESRGNNPSTPSRARSSTVPGSLSSAPIPRFTPAGEWLGGIDENGNVVDAPQSGIGSGTPGEWNIGGGDGWSVVDTEGPRDTSPRQFLDSPVSSDAEEPPAERVRNPLYDQKFSEGQ